MSPQHTKGPWEVVRTEAGIIVRTESAKKTRFGASRYAAIGGFDRSDPEQLAEALANARLIAAAPELLEALKMLVSIYKEHVSISLLLEGKSSQEIEQYFDARHVIVDKAIDDAVSAIAKTTMTGPSIADLVESGALPPPTRQAGKTLEKGGTA